MKSIWALFLYSSVALSGHLAWSQQNLRGLRVDPAYFQSLYPDRAPADIARTVVLQAQSHGVNTLFLYAYSPLHGAFYKTNYPMTEVEPDLGAQGIFALIYNEALSRGLKIIASIPINDFHQVWDLHPDWRSKKIDGTDYKPFTRTHYVSVWQPEFRFWYKGFVTDLIEKFPQLYAVEAIEPTVDCFWLAEADFNPQANAEFFKRFPKGTLRDLNWKFVRALGMTEMIGLLSSITHGFGILSATVQTWPAAADGSLLSSEKIRDEVGFDFDGALKLEKSQHLDIITAEFLWQQWAAEYGNNTFNPQWTRYASHNFAAFVAGRALPILHVEISPWHGQVDIVTPTLDQFRDTLEAIKGLGLGIDVYDHSQIENRRAWEALSVWTTSTTEYTTDEE